MDLDDCRWQAKTCLTPLMGTYLVFHRYPFSVVYCVCGCVGVSVWVCECVGV
jgi:hypothetical protein